MAKKVKKAYKAYKAEKRKSENLWILEHEFTFDAAHTLEGLAPGHPCGNLHGHTWTVTVRLMSDKLTSVGFVCDFKNVKVFCQERLKALFDHRLINANFEKNPTCEHLAAYFYDIVKERFSNVLSVKVQETAGNSVTFYRREVE